MEVGAYASKVSGAGGQMFCAFGLSIYLARLLDELGMHAFKRQMSAVSQTDPRARRTALRTPWTVSVIN